MQSPPEKLIQAVQLFLHSCPPVYTPVLKVKLPVHQHAGSVNVAVLPPKNTPKMEDWTAIQMESRAVNCDKEDPSNDECGLGRALHWQENRNLEEYEDEGLQPFK